MSDSAAVPESRLRSLLGHMVGGTLALCAVPIFILLSKWGLEFGYAIEFARSPDAVLWSGLLFAISVGAHLGVVGLIAVPPGRFETFIPEGWWAISLLLTVGWLGIIGCLYLLSSGVTPQMATQADIGRNVFVTAPLFHASAFLALAIVALVARPLRTGVKSWLVTFITATSIGPLYVLAAFVAIQLT